MRAVRIGGAVLRCRHAKRKLRPEHRGNADGLGRLREADDTVKAVVVGERESLETETGRLLGELFGMGAPIEEREVGEAVELRVPHRAGLALDSRLERLSPAGPRR